MATEDAISRVFPSVVRLVLVEGCGNRRLHLGCGVSRQTNGTIFSCIPDDDNGQFLCYILTSADLFNCPALFAHKKRRAFKIYAYLPTKKIKGEVMACDMEINIAVVKIKSVAPLPTASLTPFSDWISVSPFGVSECHAPSCHSPYPTNVVPGDEVTVVCYPFEYGHRALACSGIYSVNYIGLELDRKPFLRITCKNITSGAPVINCEGDVIGVAFNVLRDQAAVFLPINVFFKWWKQVVTYGEIRRPWIGIQVANLYTADIGRLEAIVHDCDVTDGVIVEAVIYQSPAASANMRSQDVICQCDGRPVRSFLEFTELLWDKSGEVIEAKGVRDGCHFIWKVEIRAIKTRIMPKSVVTVNKSTTKRRNKVEDEENSKKEKEVTGLEAKKEKKRIPRKRKREGISRAGADAAENLERKKSRSNLYKCSDTDKVMSFKL